MSDDLRITIGIEGRDTRVSVEPRRVDYPSKWFRDGGAAKLFAESLHNLHGWPIVDLRKPAA